MSWVGRDDEETLTAVIGRRRLGFCVSLESVYAALNRPTDFPLSPPLPREGGGSSSCVARASFGIGKIDQIPGTVNYPLDAHTIGKNPIQD